MQYYFQLPQTEMSSKFKKPLTPFPWLAKNPSNASKGSALSAVTK